MDVHTPWAKEIVAAELAVDTCQRIYNLAYKALTQAEQRADDARKVAREWVQAQVELVRDPEISEILSATKEEKG